jgi:hypothetical protein
VIVRVASETLIVVPAPSTSVPRIRWTDTAIVSS